MGFGTTITKDTIYTDPLDIFVETMKVVRFLLHLLYCLQAKEVYTFLPQQILMKISEEVSMKELKIGCVIAVTGKALVHKYQYMLCSTAKTIQEKMV